MHTGLRKYGHRIVRPLDSHFRTNRLVGVDDSQLLHRVAQSTWSKRGLQANRRRNRGGIRGDWIRRNARNFRRGRVITGSSWSERVLSLQSGKRAANRSQAISRALNGGMALSLLNDQRCKEQEQNWRDLPLIKLSCAAHHSEHMNYHSKF